MPLMDSLLSRLISAYHVLYYHEILQQTGSVSVRNPEISPTFFIRSVPAILIRSRHKLEERFVEDGSLCLIRSRQRRPETNEYHMHERTLCTAVYMPCTQASTVLSIRRHPTLWCTALKKPKGVGYRQHTTVAGFPDNYTPIQPVSALSEPSFVTAARSSNQQPKSRRGDGSTTKPRQ